MLSVGRMMCDEVDEVLTEAEQAVVDQQRELEETAQEIYQHISHQLHAGIDAIWDFFS